MATKLYMKKYTNAGPNLTSYLHSSLRPCVLDFTPSVTNTTASGTKIPCTDVAGGSSIPSISPPLAADVVISGPINLNCWALESDPSANAGMRCIISRYSDGAVISDSSKGVELTGSATVQNWTDSSPTATLVRANDRLVKTWYVTNVGTMGGAQTVTMDYAGKNAGADGDTWVQFTETILFQKEAELVQAFSTFAFAGTTLTMPGISAAGNTLVFTYECDQNLQATQVSNGTTLLTPGPAAINVTGVAAMSMWLDQNMTTGVKTYTPTYPGAPGFMVLSGREYGGLAPVPLDQLGVMNGAGASGQNLSSGSVTTTVPNEIFVYMADDADTGSFPITPGSGYVLRIDTSGAFADKSVTSIQKQVAATGTIGSPQTWGMGLVTLMWGTQPDPPFADKRRPQRPYNWQSRSVA